MNSGDEVKFSLTDNSLFTRMTILSLNKQPLPKLNSVALRRKIQSCKEMLVN